MHHGFSPIALLLGLAIIFIALMVFRAAIREGTQGSCLAGCCMWELADSLMDLGCGLIGCSGAILILIIVVLTIFGL
jgi:hypothetical protein